MSSAFIRSTMEVRHSSFSCLAATALSRIGATSTLAIGAVDPPDEVDVPDEDVGLPVDPEPPVVAVVVPGLAAVAWVPKIALMILPKMLIVSLPKGLAD